MSILLELKSKCKDFYEKNYKIVRPLLRFVLAFVCYLLIFNCLRIGDEPVVLLIPFVLAAISTFLPDISIVYISAALAAGKVFEISSVLGIAMAVIFIVIFLMVGRYDSSQLFIILAIPLCSLLHVSYVVPIVSAIFAGPTVLPAILLGVVVRYIYMGIMAAMSAPSLSVESYGSMEMFQFVVNSLIKNREMILCMIAFVISYGVTYLIRKQKANHATQLAILMGSFAMIVTVLFGNIIMKGTVDIPQFAVGMLISVVVAYIIQFFRMTLDYTGVINLQFEDDEYYYYVKAVPKLKVTIKDKTITRINPKEDENEVDNLQEEFDKVFKEENERD